MARDKNSKTEEYLKEYKSLQELYRNFSYTIKFVLENMLLTKNFKYQAVTYREKSEKSLKDKLETVNNITSFKDIDDLAGCRIIFYLDKDIQRAIQYLRDEFAVVKQNLKYSDDSYNALHLIVKLNKNRLKLSEYERFKGLKCEIQLTTVLYHSWSELAHDVIYKPTKELSEFDKRAFESIEKRFSDVMKNHIKQAQYSFDYIFDEIEKINQGKQVFDVTFLKYIVDSKSNNDIYENLKILLKYIEEFGDKTPKELKITEIITYILENSKKLKKEPIKTAFGDLPGHDYSDVADVCLEILERLKFVYLKEVFETLGRLSIGSDEKTKKKSLDVASKISKYTFWPKEKKIYYLPQLFILDEIEKWDDKKLLIYFGLVIKVAEQLLSPSYEGTSLDDYKTFTLHFGALPASDTIKKIRQRTLNILKKLYGLSETIIEKQQILHAFEQATQTPVQGDYTEALENLVLESTNTLVPFYSSIVQEADNEIIKMIKDQLEWCIKRFPKRLKGARKLLTIIDKNDGYGIYKVFVGYDYRSSEGLDWNKAERERNRRLDEYISQITTGNFVGWQKKILSVIKNYDKLEDKGQFQYFSIFLNKLGKQKPEIAQKLISKNERELEPFLIHLVAGIWESDRKKTAKKILEKWIKNGKYLLTCAYIFDYVKEIDEQLLKKVYKKAKGQSDINALTNIIGSIAGNFEQSNVGKNLFIGCIKELEKQKYYGWVNHIWFKGNSILEALTKNDWIVVLINLLNSPNIDYHLEEVLSIVAQNSPKELIDFFYKRIKIQSKKKQEDRYRYDAIPFRLHKLDKLLSNNADSVVEEIFKWFDSEDWLLFWEGSHLLEAIFPSFHTSLEEKLIKLLKSKDKNKAKIVLHVLRAYKGQVFVHAVCKEFIKQFPKSKKYQQEIFAVLSQTGTVSGEYGFVSAYERKKQEIQGWKKDKSKIVISFAQNYDAFLTKQIDFEKKRAEEDIEIRKREYGN